MNIGIVCYPTFGGSGVLATELGLELSRKGHQVHFITYRQPVRLELLNSNVHFHEVNVPDYPLFHYQPMMGTFKKELMKVPNYYLEEFQVKIKKVFLQNQLFLMI